MRNHDATDNRPNRNGCRETGAAGSQDLSESPISKKVDKQPTDQPIENLTPQQSTAIGHLLAGKTFSEAAELVGVDRRTIYEWRQQPDFKRVLQRMSDETLEMVAQRARQLLLRSADTMGRALGGYSGWETAMKILTSRNVWGIARRMPEAEEKDGEK